MTGDAVMTGHNALVALPRQRQQDQPQQGQRQQCQPQAVVAVRSDPLSSPLSLMVLAAPDRPAATDTMRLSSLLPIQRDRRLHQRSTTRGLLALAVAGGFAAVLWMLIAGSAVALGRTL